MNLDVRDITERLEVLRTRGLDDVRALMDALSPGAQIVMRMFLGDCGVHETVHVLAWYFDPSGEWRPSTEAIGKAQTALLEFLPEIRQRLDNASKCG